MSLLSRYLGGEYEQVWHEITWKDASDPILRADALAVAYATMERVKLNFEIMIPRMQEIGYRFGYDWYIERENAPDWDASAHAQKLADMHPVRSNPLPDIQERLATIEAQIKPQGAHIPLAMQAWYEVVGGVNFVGKPPIAWNDALHSRLNGGYTNLDPLRIDAKPFIEPSVDEHEVDEAHPSNVKYEFVISDDEFQKYEYSGGLIILDLPSRPQPDSFINMGWLHSSFIDYLRLAVSWGGFPGIARLPRRPDKDITYITKDLPPF